MIKNMSRRIPTKDTLFVCMLCLLLAVANSIGFFSAYIAKPAGFVYLGTIHYWEDYFLYLNHFFQGAHGAWLTVNRFTAETTNPSIVYWSNVLLGKVGSFFPMSPIASYNMSVIMLSFLVLISSYILLKTRFFPLKPRYAVIAFLFASLATSLINYVKSNDGPMVFWPFQIWRSPHFAFDRLGGAPHQLIQTLLFYWTLFFLFAPKNISRKNELQDVRTQAPLAIIPGIRALQFREYCVSPEIFIAIAGAIMAFLLATVNPIQAGFLAGIALLTASIPFIFSRGKILPIPPIRLLIITLAAIIGAIYMNGILSQEPHIQSKLWEALQQGYTTIDFLFLSIGPVLVILAIIGVLSINIKCKAIELFGFLTIAGGYILFLSPIPKMIGMSNLRILFPSSHIFWGALAVSGLAAIQKIMKGRFDIRMGLTSTVIITLFLITTIPTLIWELSQKLPTAKDQTNPLVYVPQDVYEAFTSLATTGTYDDVILANPDMHMDSLVPPLSGHTTYAGHMLATINNEKKQKQSGQFFTGRMTQDTAQVFVKSNNIRFVLTTTEYETTNVPRWYPFLKKNKSFGNVAAIYTI